MTDQHQRICLVSAVGSGIRRRSVKTETLQGLVPFLEDLGLSEIDWLCQT